MKQGFWDSARGGALLAVATLVISVVLLFGGLGRIGIWEPWESNEIAVAQEYANRGASPETTDPKATSWNGVVPTYQKRPVDRPLLKTWLVAQGVGSSTSDAVEIGSLERRARTPLALATLLMAIAGFAWLRRRFGNLAAAVSTVALVSCPAIYLGVHNLASEMMFIVCSTLCVLAFAEMTLDTRRRWLWALAFAASLVLSVADQRLLGLYLPMLVLGVFATSEAVLSELLRRRDAPSAPSRIGLVEVAGGLVALVGVVATMAWARGMRGPDGKEALYALQIASVIVPALASLGLFWFGRKSKPGRAFWSVPGLLAVGVAAGFTVWLARTYSAANPILLDAGKIFGDVRVFDFMISNHLFGTSLAENHLTFDVAVRQVGFSLFPWVALMPLGFVYLSRATRTTDDEGREIGAELLMDRLVLRRLLLVWIVTSAIVMGAAAMWQHYFYPAYFPIAASVGLVLTDSEFWTRARRSPLAGYAAGFVAITIVLMLGKDLERFPARFIETYLGLQEGFEFPEDFIWGRAYKPLKYGICAVLGVYFFGLVSWAVIVWGNIKRVPGFLKALRRRDWAAAFGTPSNEPPFVVRMERKEAIRAGSGPVSALARAAETPQGYAPALALFMAVVAAMFLFAFIPNVTNHLSQRGVFETYTSLAGPGEKLWRYQVSSRENSVYLTDVETIKGASDLTKLFESDERFFAVIPRSKLAAINFEIRNRFKRNLAVLDARSSRLLLVSNKLGSGEKDVGFVADKIVEGEPQVDFPVTYESGGQKKHATFDNQLEFLGYSLDKKAVGDALVEYGWGETMTITYFFRVLKRVPSSQKIFLHVDYPGNRINGDHVPNNGEFPTNYWMVGDVVKDVHPLKIDSYSTPGEYSLNMGFFLGSRRMKVEPREAHDGNDRITIGKIRVTSGL